MNAIGVTPANSSYPDDQPNTSSATLILVGMITMLYVVFFSLACLFCLFCIKKILKQSQEADVAPLPTVNRESSATDGNDNNLPDHLSRNAFYEAPPAYHIAVNMAKPPSFKQTVPCDGQLMVATTGSIRERVNTHADLKLLSVSDLDTSSKSKLLKRHETTYTSRFGSTSRKFNSIPINSTINATGLHTVSATGLSPISIAGLPTISTTGLPSISTTGLPSISTTGLPSISTTGLPTISSITGSSNCTDENCFENICPLLGRKSSGSASYDSADVQFNNLKYRKRNFYNICDDSEYLNAIPNKSSLTYAYENVTYDIEDNDDNELPSYSNVMDGLFNVAQPFRSYST